jgi:hypothetical protein
MGELDAASGADEPPLDLPSSIDKAPTPPQGEQAQPEEALTAEPPAALPADAPITPPAMQPAEAPATQPAGALAPRRRPFKAPRIEAPPQIALAGRKRALSSADAEAGAASDCTMAIEPPEPAAAPMPKTKVRTLSALRKVDSETAEQLRVATQQAAQAAQARAAKAAAAAAAAALDPRSSSSSSSSSSPMGRDGDDIS